MKKYIILISIIITSCSTRKIEEKIVKDFIIGKKIKSNSSATPSFLIIEAESNENTLSFYEMSFLDKNLELGEKRYIFSPRNFSNWPIDIDEIKTLDSISKKDSNPYYWDTKMSQIIKLQIIKRKEFSKKINKLIIPISSSGHILSKPILSLNKKYAFFSYSIIFSSSGSTKEVFLVKKENGKWKIMASFIKNYDYLPPSWRGINSQNASASF